MKREDLKNLGLTQEQTEQVMALHGADIERQKSAAAALAAEREALAGRLAEAAGKLEGYDPAWREKAAEARQEAEAKVAALERRQALAQQAAGLHFSSESARRAFVADLEAKDLPFEDGKLAGFEEFVQAYREADPGAFGTAAPLPAIVRPTDGGAGAAVTREAFAKMGYRQRLQLKKTEPTLYEQLKER